MDDPVVTSLEPKDSSMRHPKVEPIQNLPNPDLISGNAKPDIEGKLSYSAGDYRNMFLAIARDYLANKVTGSVMPSSFLVNGVVVLLIIACLIFIGFKVGLL